MICQSGVSSVWYCQGSAGLGLQGTAVVGVIEGPPWKPGDLLSMGYSGLSVLGLDRSWKAGKREKWEALGM